MTISRPWLPLLAKICAAAIACPGLSLPAEQEPAWASRVQKERTDLLRNHVPYVSSLFERRSVQVFPVGRADVLYVLQPYMIVSAGTPITLACIRRTQTGFKIAWTWHMVYAHSRGPKWMRAGTLILWLAQFGCSWKSIPLKAQRDVAQATAFIQYQYSPIGGSIYYRLIDANGMEEPIHRYELHERIFPNGNAEDILIIQTTPEEIAKWKIK